MEVIYRISMGTLLILCLVAMLIEILFYRESLNYFRGYKERYKVFNFAGSFSVLFNIIPFISALFNENFNLFSDTSVIIELISQITGFLVIIYVLPGIICLLIFLCIQEIFSRELKRTLKKNNRTKTKKEKLTPKIHILISELLIIIILIIGFVLTSVNTPLIRINFFLNSNIDFSFKMHYSDEFNAAYYQTILIVLMISLLVLLSVTGFSRLALIQLIFIVINGAFYEISAISGDIRDFTQLIALNSSLFSNSNLEAYLTLETLTIFGIPLLFSIWLYILGGLMEIPVFGDLPPVPKYVLNFRIKLVAIQILFHELGFGKVLKILEPLEKAKKEGEPWKNIPPAETTKDKESRELIGEALILYRILKDLEKNEESNSNKTLKNGKKNKKNRKSASADELIPLIVKNSAIVQLFSLVPRIKVSDLKNKNEDELISYLDNIVGKFPNADYEISEFGSDHFIYKITRCRLVELAVDSGFSELKTIFCLGDAVFFENYQPEVKFERPKNIAKGDNYCEFIFSVKTN